ncbi:MAG: DUF4349 domain-containing protein [Chitinophagaceae bacterium]
MKINTKLFIIGLIVLIFACHNNNVKKDAIASAVQLNKIEAATEKPEEGVYQTDTIVTHEANKLKHADQKIPPNIDWDKKIIKTGKLTIEIKDFKLFNANLREVIKKAGGYIAQEEQNQSEYKLENSVTIKVPVDQFEETLNMLSIPTEKIIEKKISSEDVTGEVIDTKSRMEAKKQVRQRYLDLLKQAKNMEEILLIQNEINDKQIEIESASGRINYLTHSAAYSTIQLTYYQVLNPSAITTNEPGFGKRFVQSLKDGAKWISELLLILVYIWPIWILLPIVWIFFKKNRFAKIKR